MNTSTQVSPGSCRVVAPSSREALRLVREKLGPEAIVLSNKVTAEGVEIVAALEKAIAAVADGAVRPVATQTPAGSVPLASRPPADLEDVNDSRNVLREIHSMRGMIEDQLAGIAWNEMKKRDPVRGQLLRTMLAAGFSARLAKETVSSLSADQNHVQGLARVKSVLEGRLPVLESEEALMVEGGVYALTGPTGVGKTTTTAKLAARCVMSFGPEKLALVTTDSYRIGAYEQLRIYGQILGVSVHAVKDAADLELVLAQLRDKHMVLIDTVGMSQRDRAVSDQIAMLSSASRPVKRLLLLNGSSHGDTLNEVVQAYRNGERAAGANSLVGCIFTKVDEATHPGALLDMAIRHQLPVHYISSGQKVPENLMLADRRQLVNGVFEARGGSALFVPGEADLEERPTLLLGHKELPADDVVSDRLRSQCHQLIQVLTHNAQELTSSADALSSGQVGFDETRAIWRKLASADAGQVEIAQDLQSRACTDATECCSSHVLLLAGETDLFAGRPADTALHRSAVLLSDRTGLPFAAMHGLSPFPALAGAMHQHLFSKPFVHLLVRVPDVELMAQWHCAGLHWISGAPASLRVIATGSPGTVTLAKLAATQSFGGAQPFLFRGRPALMSVAEMAVSAHASVKRGTTGYQGLCPPLRCIVRRVVDAGSGRLLAQRYVLVSAGIQATAMDAAQWPLWRDAAEAHFRLLAHALSQLAEPESCDPAKLSSRILFAAQACTTVERLQRTAQPWAQTAREVLARLAGRPVRPGRPTSAPVLMDGLGKCLVLLDALAQDTAAQLPSRDVVAAPG